MSKGNPICPYCSNVLRKVKGLYIPHYAHGVGEMNLIEPYICTNCWIPEHPVVE